MHTWIAVALFTLLFQQADIERRIIDHLKANVKPGKPVIVSELFNNVFTSPEERKVLDRLYNTFFKIPLFLAQYYTSSKRIPTLEEISEQFRFKVPGQADVMLKVMEADPRVPKFIERDPKSGEITRIDVERIKADPRFGRVVDRTIAGWEGKLAPPYSIQTYSGETLTSPMMAGKAHLLYFWFTDCPPCMKTSPLLVELYKKYAPGGFQIVAANADHVLELPYTDQDRMDYVRKMGITFTTAHLNPEMQQAYGAVNVFPTMFFIDKNGIVVKHFVNFQEKAILEEAIKEALTEPRQIQ